MTSLDTSTRLSTGIEGLDRVMQGGLIPGRSYLVRGGPGTGKTTLGLHFLTDGSDTGKSSLFISLSEPETQIRENAAVHSLDLSSVEFLDLSPAADFFTESESYDIFSAAEVEGKPTNEEIVAAVEETEPDRVFIDSMTQFRHLCSDPYQFRKQVLSLLRFLQDQGTTVVFTSEAAGDEADQDLKYMADGVLSFSFAESGRVVSVEKFRASDFEAGEHSVRISKGGLQVFPRLVPEAFNRDVDVEPLATGIPAMDELLGGGVERGTVTIISGPSGVGKSSIAMQISKEAASRGERTAVFLFDENREVLLKRCESINIPVGRMVDGGNLSVEYVEPLAYPPDQFAARVRQEVEEHDARIVVLDSMAGYRIGLRGDDLSTNLHRLCKYLTNMGVAVVITNEVHRITGDFEATEGGLSFLADNIIYLRYLEADGGLRKAIGVLKKRLSDFEKSLRDMRITEHGIRVGPRLTGMQGILSGTPSMSTDGDAGRSDESGERAVPAEARGAFGGDGR